jgi:TolA-binding protein
MADELEPLATALRQELGTPPAAWQDAQRARLREGLRRPVRRHALRRATPWLVASVALAGAVIWFVASRPPPSMERWLVAEELREPVKLDDGSRIVLEPGGRGRLFADGTTVRFDLHQGRASFDVNPARKRTWTISAGKNEVRVIGTRFSVFYGPGDAFEVDVERGVVAVRVPDRNANVELKAGDHFRGRPGRMELADDISSARAPEPKPVGASAPEASSAAPPGPDASAAAARDPDWQARYLAGNYAESLALVRASGLDRRLAELSPSALSALSEAARLGGDPELAARALTMLLRRFPGAPEAREGRFLLGRVHALRGDQAAAIDAFESYLGSGASSVYANETLGRLMDLYSARGDTDRARKLARRYLERAPNGPYGRLARSLVTRDQ